MLSLTDLASDMFIEVEGEGDRDGRSAGVIIGVGTVLRGRAFLWRSGETGVLALDGALVGTMGCC